MTKIDSYPIYIEPFHVDFTGRLFMGILGNHMLNAANHHSQQRGWGIGKLQEQKMTWVLSRLSIEMNEMPRAYQHCTISTWVESVIKLFTNRNFAVHDAEGNVLGYARSVWAMIDMETRQPCNLLELYDGDILNYVVSDEENVCPIEGHGRFRFRDAQEVRTINTYYSDVDINGHINSIKYIEHILDLFTQEQLQRGIHRFEIAYKAESYLGDTLTFYTQLTPDGATDIEVRKNSTPEAPGDVVCQARVRFNGYPS